VVVTPKNRTGPDATAHPAACATSVAAAAAAPQPGLQDVLGLLLGGAVKESDYLLSNTEPETADRFDGLDEAFDPVSIGHLRRLGVGVGARCLEIGAGSGSIARWLAGHVGPAGHVVATDLDTRWFRHNGSPQLEVRQLDVVDDPIPDGPWDVVHERLVLQHVPERLDVLDRLVEALAPGGWILVEDFDTAEVRTIDREGPHHELIVSVARAFNGLLRSRGGVSEFAASGLRNLRARGLVDVGASGHVNIDCGGRGFAKVVAANTRQIRDGFVAAGLQPADLDRYLEVLAAPDTIIGSSVLISTWGRRPPEQA
jgi:SAM-dependent methyltransferase